jgi:predicted MFS family arabinose efflux permease
VGVQPSDVVNPPLLSSPAREAEASADQDHVAATGTFAAFRYPSFRYLWLGNLCSSGGMWVQQIAINWLIYDLTGSAAMLAWVQAVRTAPWAITAPFQGVLIDRLDRRYVIMSSQIFITLAAFVFALDVAAGRVEVWHILLFTFLTGCGTAINNTTRRAIVPSVVPRTNLVNAAALGNVPMNLMRTLGPAVGGVLIQFVGMAVNFFLQTALYGLSWLTTLFVRLPKGVERESAARVSYRQSTMESLQFVRQDQPVLSVLVLGMLACLFFFPVQSLIPVFARDFFHLGADGYGVFLMATGVGSVVGTISLASMRHLERKAPLLFGLMMFAILMPLVFAWTRSIPLALLVLAVQGACQMTFFSLTQAMVQILTPNALLGRVMSLDNLNAAMIPLGAVIGGFLADAIGAPLALTIWCSVGLAAVLLTFAALPAARRL